MDELAAMERAIALATGRHTHPNPTVGAVVVADGVVVGEGWHRGPGADHAEVVALAEAGPAARGATVVVTLEPCAHQGRTPPCVDALLSAAVARVVVAVEDPDPRVAGRGIAALRAAGVTVDVGVGGDEAEALDPAYFHHRRTGRPLVTLKLAATLDGATAAADGTSQWITGPAARADAHRLRAAADAVVVGAGTLRTDDPALTVRLDGHTGPQPRPVVVAGSLDLPSDSVLASAGALVLATRPIPGWDVTRVDGVEHPDPRASVAALAEAGLLAVLLEGGPTLAGVWWRAGVVDRVVLYLAGLVAGGVGRPLFSGVFATLADARPVVVGGVTPLGRDLRLDVEVV